MSTAPRGRRIARRTACGIAIVIGLTPLPVQPAQAQHSAPDIVGAVDGLLSETLLPLAQLSQAPVPQSPAQTGEVAQLLSGINAVRAGVGAGPVELDPMLSTVAQAWALVMAAAGEISHNPSLSDQVSGFVRVAENVGRGPSLDWIHNGLINSPGHYKNMVNPNYSLVGLGVLNAGRQVWVVEVFVQPAGGGHSAPPPTGNPPTRTSPTVGSPVEPAAPAGSAASTTPNPATSTPRSSVRSPGGGPVAKAVAPAVPTAPPEPSEWLGTVLERLSLLDRLSA